MRIIKHSDVVALNIQPLQYMSWVKEALLAQQDSVLPAKISVSLPNDGFFNTMPCYIPSEEVMGVKVVNRYLDNNPALDASLLLYNSVTGEQKALMDATLITSMRTGAVAATSISTLKNAFESVVVGIMGLGVTARATLLCLLEADAETQYEVKLMRYKDQAESFVERFELYSNVRFEIVDSYERLIVGSDVVLSCISTATQVYGEDDWFKPGVLVVPVHTRGFQNCDLFFDKVYGDLREQISHFQYFDRFKYFNEFSKVLQGDDAGRESVDDRILVYNIGIALHDVYVANKVYQMIERKNELPCISFKESIEKFYV